MFGRYSKLFLVILWVFLFSLIAVLVGWYFFTGTLFYEHNFYKSRNKESSWDLRSMGDLLERQLFEIAQRLESTPVELFWFEWFESNQSLTRRMQNPQAQRLATFLYQETLVAEKGNFYLGFENELFFRAGLGGFVSVNLNNTEKASLRRLGFYQQQGSVQNDSSFSYNFSPQGLLDRTQGPSVYISRSLRNGGNAYLVYEFSLDHFIEAYYEKYRYEVVDTLRRSSVYASFLISPKDNFFVPLDLSKEKLFEGMTLFEKQDLSTSIFTQPFMEKSALEEQESLFFEQKFNHLGKDYHAQFVEMKTQLIPWKVAHIYSTTENKQYFSRMMVYLGLLLVGVPIGIYFFLHLSLSRRLIEIFKGLENVFTYWKYASLETYPKMLFPGEDLDKLTTIHGGLQHLTTMLQIRLDELIYTRSNLINNLDNTRHTQSAFKQSGDINLVSSLKNREHIAGEKLLELEKVQEFSQELHVLTELTGGTWKERERIYQESRDLLKPSLLDDKGNWDAFSHRDLDFVCQELDALFEFKKNKLSEATLSSRELSQTAHSLVEANSLVAEIATQTNMLAMNAAIEAAHAKEHGRSFAVIAEEIRSLASSSAQHSLKIKEELLSIVENAELITHYIDDLSIRFENSSQENQVLTRALREYTQELPDWTKRRFDTLDLMGLLEDFLRSSAPTRESLQGFTSIQGHFSSFSEQLKRYKDFLAKYSKQRENFVASLLFFPHIQDALVHMEFSILPTLRTFDYVQQEIYTKEENQDVAFPQEDQGQEMHHEDLFHDESREEVEEGSALAEEINEDQEEESRKKNLEE